MLQSMGLQTVRRDGASELTDSPLVLSALPTLLPPRSGAKCSR